MPDTSLKAQRARAAATVAAYWPRTTNPQHFATQIALARRQGKHELAAHLDLIAAEHGIEWSIASGAQLDPSRSIFDVLEGITKAAARIERAKVRA